MGHRFESELSHHPSRHAGYALAWRDGIAQHREVATIATSRTGTAQWKAIVKEVRERELDNGLTNCPLCGTGLDWLYSKRPNSAEVDHIIPHAQGGEDSANNARVICRHCNQSRGGKEGRAKQAAPKRIELTTRANW